MTDARILMGNQYLEARLKASKYNERFATQAGASELLEVDAATLGRWERGETVPSNHKIRLMADVYNAPILMHNYCAHACPVGCGRIAPLDHQPIERTALSLHKYGRQISDSLDALLDMLEDGVIEETEAQDFASIVAKLRNIRQRIDALMLHAEQMKGSERSAGT